MIIGVKQTDTDTGEEYDYLGVVYPEGSMGDETQFFFEHGDIEQTFYRGYEDEERDIFIENLEKFYSNMDEE